MSEVTSTLSVKIDTGRAASDLLALQKGLEGAALGVARLGREIQNHSGNIQRVLSELSKHGFGGLSKSLNTETSKVGASMRQLEKEVVAAAEKTGKRAGAAISEGMKEGATKVSALTRNLVTYFEIVSRESKATSSRVRSAMEAMTTLQSSQNGAHQDLLGMYRQMESAIHGVEAAERRFAESTSSRVKTAVASLVAENAELTKMRAHYGALQRDAAKSRASSFGQYGLSMGRSNLQAAITANTGAGAGASGMSAQYSEGISAFGPMKKDLDAVGGSADKSRTAMKRWSNEAKIVHDTARGAAAGVGYLWMTWGNIGAMAAGFGTIRGVAAGIKELATIEQQLTHAANAGGGTVESLNSRVMSMYGNGNKMVHTAGQMSEALKNLTLAGFSTDEAFQMLTHTYKFAAAGEMDLASAAQGVQQTMNSFRLPMSETGRVTDVLAKAAAASAVTIEDMVQAMKTGSVVGAMYNVSIEDFAKSAALLGKVGIVGQAAGTAIKNFYTEVSSPKSKKAMEAMKQFDLSFYAVKNGVTQLKPLNGIIDELRDKFKGLSETNQQIFLTNLNDIFNERGIKEAAQLIKMTTEEYEKLNSTMDESAGFVEALYGKLSNTTQGIYEDLKAQGMASLTMALKGAEPAIQSLGRGLRDLVTSTGFKEFLTSTISLIARLTQLLTDHGSTVIAVAAAYAGFKIAAGAVHLLFGWVSRLAGAMGALRGAMALSTLTTFSGTVAAVGRGVATTTTGLVGLRGVLALIGGPIGVIAGLLTAGITLWALWGDSAQEAARKAKQAANDQHQTTKDLLEQLQQQRREQALGANGHQMARIEDALKAEDRAIKALQAKYKNNIGQRMSSDDQKIFDARVASMKALGAEYGRLKAAAAAAAPATNPAEGVTPTLGTPDTKAPKSTSPLSVADYKAEIKLYNQSLQEINRAERDALKRSQAVWEAGLGTEQMYLAERNAIRAKADDDAKAQLEAYVAAQTVSAGEAEAEYLKQVKEAHSLGLMNDEATLNKIRTAANRIEEAYAKAALAREQYDARSSERSSGEALDALAGMKDKYGNPDDNIRRAQESVAAIKAENDAVRTLTDTLRDKTLVSIEASIRSTEGLLAEAQATAGATGATREQIAALRDKLGTLQSLKAGYEKEKALQQAMQGDALRGARAGMRDYFTEVETVGTAMRKSVTSAFKGMEDALTSFVMTGKLDFKSLANSIIQDIIRIQVRQAISSSVTGLGSLFGFADGGIMTSSGSLPLRAYSNGGIASSPQFALYGEGRQPEAYVPLPDGRTIPVTMTGGGNSSGGDVNTSVVVHVSGDGNTTVSRDGAGKLGQQIEAEVMKVIFREKRPGGVLSEA